MEETLDENRTPSRTEIGQLVQSQNQAAKLAKRELGRIWMELDGLPPLAVRDGLLDLVPAIIDKYGDMANDAAAEWYDRMRLKWFNEKIGSHLAEPAGADKMRNILRKGITSIMTNGGGEEELLRYLNQTVDRNVREPARNTILQTAKHDPCEPRWARIPQGPTCAFCIMLAGRGWDYKSAESAGAGFNEFHAQCNCQIVPSWSEHPHVDGYDPDGIEHRYLQCRSAIEHDLKERYKQERKVYYDDEGKAHQETESDFEERALLAEMRKRSRGWLYDGTLPEISLEEGATPLAKELKTAATLQMQGFSVLFRKTRDAEQKRTSDVFIGDGETKEVWEFKQPTGNGKQTIAHQFEEAAGQSSRLVLDTRALDKNGRWNDAEVFKAIKINLTHHFKGSDGAVMQFDEVLVVLEGNKIRRIKRSG